MICADCAAAADYDSQRHPVEAITVRTYVEHERLRRGHARCRVLQLTTADEKVGYGHRCDCQHGTRFTVVGYLKVVPAGGAPPQSDEKPVADTEPPTKKKRRS